MEVERVSDPGDLIGSESEIDIASIDPKHILVW